MSYTETSYSRTRTASKKRFLVMFIFGFLLLSALVYVSCLSYNNEKYGQNIIEQGIRVNAEIYKAFPPSHGKYGSSNLAGCLYKYVDENGLEYDGKWGKFKTLEEAEQYVGKQVEIFIDGKGKSILADVEPNVTVPLIFIIIFTLLAGANIAGIIIMSIKIHKERLLKKQNKI